MPTPTASVKVNPLTGALIDPIAATFAAANGLLTGGSSDAKDSVRVATTANGTLATAFENGDTVDGIVLATGNRILIKNQSAPAENGIYTVNASGAPTRATDFDAWTEIVGAFTNVEAGTVNAGTQWLCNVVSGGTLGTTAITFVVPKNFVDLTTNQTVGGNKYFSPSSMMGGVTFSKDGVLTAVNAQLVFPEDDSVLAVFASAGELSLRTTGVTDVTFPTSGTLATTTGNVATATALATARNIFNISFNGTANVAGDATNTGHFASIPGTGAAGHFITENGTAPTLIAGRSAWYSDGSGIPSFKNGTGTAVTLVRSSDLGTNVATFLATPSGANLASALTSALPVSKGGTGLTAGTSGGIPAFTATGTIASSALLAANALVIGGGAGVAPSTTTTGAGVLVANINRPVFATTATAAGTTTLTVTSAATQEFTGSTTQTVTMPVVTTLVAGWATTFINKSTGNVTLNSSGSNSIVVLAAGQSATLVCKSISADTTAAAWDVVGVALFVTIDKGGSSPFQGFTDGVEAVVTFAGTKIGTMQGAWASNAFTAPQAGVITVRPTLLITNNLDAMITISIRNNGTPVYTPNFLGPFSVLAGSGVACVLPYNISVAANDVIDITATITTNDSSTKRISRGSSQLSINYVL